MTTKAHTASRHGMRHGLRAALVGVALLVGGMTANALAVPPAQQAPVAFEDVVSRLKLGDPRIRLEALQMLGQAGYIEAAGSIAPLLTDSVAEVQLASMDTLLSLFLVDEPYTRKYGASIINQKGASLPLLAFAQGPGQLVANQFPPELIKGLVTALDSPVMEVRFDAVYTLGVFGPVAVRRGTMVEGRLTMDRLAAMAKDPNPLLRLAATQVLGRLTAAALRNERANTDLLTRRIVSGDQVIAGINDADPFVKQASMKAVGDMRLERAVQSLIDLANYYRTGPMALASYEALAHIAHPGSLQALVGALASRDEHVRAVAVAGIGRSSEKAALFDAETRLAKDKSRHVKLALAFARAKHGDLSQVVVVAEGFRRGPLAPAAYDYLLELGPAIADTLAPIAAHRDAKVRAGVAEVLGLIGNEQSVFVVQSLSRDRSGAVAAAGVRSAKRLSPRPSNAPRLM